MSDERAERCETCRFFDTTDRDGNFRGECHRYPPNPSMTAQQQKEAISAVGPNDGLLATWFPEVTKVDWCGEFQPLAVVPFKMDQAPCQAGIPRTSHSTPSE